MTGGLARHQPAWIRDIDVLGYEWRRLVGELLGTFLLVLAAAGAPVVDRLTHGGIGRTAEVIAPGLTVLAVVLATGAVSGAHLNPVVTVAFTLRGDFGWHRVPGYLLAQVAGAGLAVLGLRLVLGAGGEVATTPGPGFGSGAALAVEIVLTFGLVTTVLGTASSAQNVGPLSAVGVGGYIVLAGLWAGPVSGASMNPARSLGPVLVGLGGPDLWVYLLGPTIGMVLAVGAAWVLRGPGGGPGGRRSAQGALGRSATVPAPAGPSS